VRLDAEIHGLLVVDDVGARGEHELSARYTLPPGAELDISGAAARVVVGDRAFAVRWSGWHVAHGAAWFSPSYGTKMEAPALELRATASALRLAIAFAPADAATSLDEWLRREATP
jgi:hypothetical protein